jgi:DNA-binding winged helix-turn-helix (wHTH) protein
VPVRRAARELLAITMTEDGTFEFGPFRLSTEKSVLWRGEQLVPVTPKALDLLRVLVEHRGDVVTKRELMSRVWTDTVVEEGNLSVTVTALRKALDPQANGRSYIQTVPRRGYRFDAPVRALGEPLPPEPRRAAVRVHRPRAGGPPRAEHG